MADGVYNKKMRCINFGYSSTLEKGLVSFVVLIFWAFTLPPIVAGELVIAPRHTESKVGDTTYFNCSTNLEHREIFWNHGLKYIYTGETIIYPYRGRFEIDRNASNGSHNLVIHSVELSDAGEYICIDDDGHGTRQSAELVVLDKDPDCQSNIQPDGVIGQNIFNISQDEVQLTCNVTYHGNIPPQMEWKKVGDNSSSKNILTSFSTSANRIIYTLKLKGDISLDNSSYVCQTTRSIQKQYKCISETIKVLYFLGGIMTEQNVFRGGEITCIASNNTFSCISQWYHGNYTCPLSCDDKITTHLLGEYLCSIKCNVRGTDYSFTALKAVVVEAPTSPPPSKSGTIASSVVVPIVIIALVVLIAVYIVRNNKRKANQKILRQIRQLKNEEQKVEWLVTMNSIHNRDEGASSYDDEFAKEEIELLHKIKREETFEEKAILGVAILGGELFLVHEESSSLEVYACNKFNLPSKLLEVKEVVAAVDICSCKRNNCLYIMDKKCDGAPKEVVKISTEGELLMNWPTKDSAVGNLSATAEGNVIITVHDKHMLLEYSPDGKWVRDIKLSGRINPWHAIKLNNDRYIVSHGTLFDPLHRICRVNKKGTVEKSFGKEIGSTENRVNMPFYLAVGSTGFVMVADLCNSRVMLLDSNLEFKTKIVPQYKQGFQSPRRICLDEGLLVVVIGAGIPKREIRVETCDLKKETEEVDILIENENTKETIHGEAHDSEKGTEEGAPLKKIDDPKETINVEATDSWEQTEETDILIENENTKETNHGEAHDSEKGTEEGAPLKKIDDPKETINVEATDSWEQTEENEMLASFKSWLRRRKKLMKQVDVLKRIEEDCRLLVFDIQPLLQKYNND